MISITYENVYSGDIYPIELYSSEVESFDDVLKYSKTLQNIYNTGCRICIYSDNQKDIKTIPIYMNDVELDDINSVYTEYTLDMCPIIQVVNKKSDGLDRVYDFYQDLFQLSEGDIVYNKRDGRFYYIRKNPNIYSLQDIMWNDDIPSSYMSKYDIHKATVYEYEYFDLSKLTALVTTNDNDEYARILQDILANNPRLIT